jgi:fumarate hydratase class I
VGIGVSCSADRNIKAKITEGGIYLEQLEKDPSKYLPETDVTDDEAVNIDLNRPMDEIRSILAKYPVAARLSLSGTIIVARDIAHARLKERLDKGEGIPQYFKDHIIYYAGPAKTPEGHASGSFGPTTAGRMDTYVPVFQEQGASMVMLAKGNRSKTVTDSCKKYGGFYLGSIGGPAARLGRECITKVEILEFPELGMEAIYKINVKDFPAFIIVDDKGNDFFENLL